MKRTHPFIIAGNWKMNPASAAEAQKLTRGYKSLTKKHPQVSIRLYCPDSYLQQTSKAIKDSSIVLGAQHSFPGSTGSSTGEESLPILSSVGAQEVLIGHSWRRDHYSLKESNITVLIENALSYSMPMCVCFGETVRDDKGDYIQTLTNQLEAICAPFKKPSAKLSLLTIAYEPVWAIGAAASRAATPDEVFSTMILIQNILSDHFGERRAKKIPLLYGGSVNPANASELSNIKPVSGFLIGRASLSSDSLKRIIEAVASDS